MKKRTFFTTLLLFLLFFNAAILLITAVLLRDSVGAQKERCLAEHYVIASSLIRDMGAMESRGVRVEASLEELMRPYAYFSQDRRTRLAVYQGDRQVFSNMERGEDLTFDATGLVLESRTLAVGGGERPLLTIAGRLSEPYQEYSLLYQYDMGDTIASWRQTKNLLFLSGGAFSVLLALCLLLLLGRIFRPLGQISAASRRIAAGDYEDRLPLSGHDELTELSGNFNHMAEAVQGQMSALQEAAEQKQRFVDNFAHELRTPLTTIYGYAEYLQKAAVTEEDRLSATDYILTECKRMQQLSGQLLDLALLRNGEILQEQVSVSQLFRLVESTSRPKAAEKELELSFANQLDTLLGNPDLLQILLRNLLDNAIKACRTKGSVLVSAYEEGLQQVISVRDDGKGMSQEQLPHVTEAFYRVDRARNRRDGGAGLGLALCRQIAELHHARLEFSSAPNQGTTVKIIFTA